ncbi:hypothetical protein BG011_004987 [Mortierella polycephala]|uniref:CASTOR ACT domain-containing protein n=1 Tax=Mortierella polycephala TaxID=41804 RepID=A0A9P6Q086_9FUNG|nr:hypothetical protein BG011_004987 [Mortierella polycephala]
MTVSLLADRLCLLRFPREDLELCSHAILKHILFRDYSNANRQGRHEPLFSYIDNSLEISIFGDAAAISQDFPRDLCPGLEISNHIYRALQVDSVSIFYMSTYQTDLLFFQENRLPIVSTTLSKDGITILLDEDLDLTSLDTPKLDQLRFQKYPMHDIQEEHTREYCNGGHSADTLQNRGLSRFSLATPPESHDVSSDDNDNDDDDDDFTEESHTIVGMDIYSTKRHGERKAGWSEDSTETEDEYDTAKASPTTMTTFELRQQAIRKLPENSLRCVGLNTELEDGHQPWILKVIKVLFYHDKVKEQASCDGRGPKHDAPRFFSFTATSECVSMITDTYILDEFEEHELFMDMETCPLRLIQLDLQRFGLDKFGIIHSVARPLTEAGIELLYLSTFSTANILVADYRLSDAEKILTLVPILTVGPDTMSLVVVLVSMLGLYGVARGKKRLMDVYLAFVVIFIGVQVFITIKGFLSGPSWVRNSLRLSWDNAYDTDPELIRSLQIEFKCQGFLDSNDKSLSIPLGAESRLPPCSEVLELNFGKSLEKLVGVFTLTILFKYLAVLDREEKHKEEFEILARVGEKMGYLMSDRQQEAAYVRVPLLLSMEEEEEEEEEEEDQGDQEIVPFLNNDSCEEKRQIEDECAVDMRHVYIV